AHQNQQWFTSHITRMQQLKGADGNPLKTDQAQELLMLWVAFLLKAGVKEDKIKEYMQNESNPVIGSRGFVEEITNGKFGEKAKKAILEFGVTEFKSEATGTGSAAQGTGASVASETATASATGFDRFNYLLDDARSKGFEDFYNAHKDDKTSLERPMAALDLKFNDEQDKKAFLYWLWKLAQLTKGYREEEPSSSPPPASPSQATAPPTTPQATTTQYDLTTTEGRKKFADEVLLSEQTITQLKMTGVNIDAYKKAVEEFKKTEKLVLYFLHRGRDEKKVGNRRIDRVKEILEGLFEQHGLDISSNIIEYDPQNDKPKARIDGQKKERPADVLEIRIEQAEK
ncbi:MAG: hypothetical protein QXS91_04015, partial [Candidatus Anstonellales archaeon]